MVKAKKTELRCEHCKKWFNSPLMFDNKNAFETANLKGNATECPYCKKITGCDKENMRVVFEDGIFAGDKILLIRILI
jgi:hypothetical protein